MLFELRGTMFSRAIRECRNKKGASEAPFGGRNRGEFRPVTLAAAAENCRCRPLQKLTNNAAADDGIICDGLTPPITAQHSLLRLGDYMPSV